MYFINRKIKLMTVKKTKKVKKKTNSKKANIKLKPLESEKLQDSITDKDEKLMSEKKQKRPVIKMKKKTKVDKNIQKIGSDANRSLSKYLQEISKYQSEGLEIQLIRSLRIILF